MPLRNILQRNSRKKSVGSIDHNLVNFEKDLEPLCHDTLEIVQTRLYHLEWIDERLGDEEGVELLSPPLCILCFCNHASLSSSSNGALLNVNIHLVAKRNTFLAIRQELQ